MSQRRISLVPAPIRKAWRHLPQFGPGVYELREALDTNAYRLMYVVRLRSAVYVLHAFMKKSKSGVGLPKTDKRLIAARLKRAIEIDKEFGHEKN